jgi:hypothetical protein
MVRIEGAKTGQEKALALWKWFRILVSPTGGGYVYEVPDRIVNDPHKIFTVYGHHQCDGQSWAMVSLWRAAGLIALDECHTGARFIGCSATISDNPLIWIKLRNQPKLLSKALL